MSKCEHNIKTKAIQRVKSFDGDWWVHNRVWYCLECKTVIETIDMYVEHDSPLDKFTLEVSQ